MKGLWREDEYDVELEQPIIKSVSEAANMTEQLRDFAQFNGHLQESSLMLNKVNNILYDIKLWKPKQKTLTSNYFSSFRANRFKRQRLKRLEYVFFLRSAVIPAA